MRGAVRGVTPLRRIRMRERAYYFNAHFRVGRGIHTVLYQRLSIPSRNPQKTKTQTAYHTQRKIYGFTDLRIT
jgi:hypothetical protein